MIRRLIEPIAGHLGRDEMQAEERTAFARMHVRSLQEIVRALLRPQVLLIGWKVAFVACYTTMSIQAALAVFGNHPLGVADLLADPLVRGLAVVAVGMHFAWWARLLLDRGGMGRVALAAEVARLAALQSTLLREAEETGIRVAAVRALGSLRERAPVATLEQVAARDANARVRAAAAEALLVAQGRRLSYAPAMHALRDGEPAVRESAARALAALAQLREEGSATRTSGAPLLADASLLAATQARGALAALGIEAPYLELLDPS